MGRMEFNLRPARRTEGFAPPEDHQERIVPVTTLTRVESRTLYSGHLIKWPRGECKTGNPIRFIVHGGHTCRHLVIN